MTTQKKVKYLKIDRGRYFYQRRVPDRLHHHLGIKRWQIPCGDVSYSKAVQKVVTWAEEHDALIESLNNPDALQNARVRSIRDEEKRFSAAFDVFGLDVPYEMTSRREGEPKVYSRNKLPRPWQAAAKLLEKIEDDVAGKPNVELMISLIDTWINAAKMGKPATMIQEFPREEAVVRYLEQFDADLVKKAMIRLVDRSKLGIPPEITLDRLKEAYDVGFGPDRKPPTDADDRDEFDFIKRKLERKISELSDDPNTLSAVLEKYCDFNSIRTGTRSKYKRELARLIKITGDVPIGHVRTDHLRTLRDDLIGDLKPASIHAVFTPIKGLLNFAFDEDLIDSNPMMGVKLPRDKRPIEERKWKSFEPSEVSRLLAAASEVWGQPALGLTTERRLAVWMVVRVLAFSGMRPIEVIRLKADDVNDRLIRIAGSKTESSTRVVPLHPEVVPEDWTVS